MNPHDHPADAALVELSLIGSLRACADGDRSVLPTLRKARALFVILALSEGQSAPRRYLAGLLWSRNDPAQALARLRDTLRTLRQSIAEVLGETDLIRLVGDRVALRPGAVRVDVHGWVAERESARVSTARSPPIWTGSTRRSTSGWRRCGDGFAVRRVMPWLRASSRRRRDRRQVRSAAR